jgi:anti-sigma B factor antagonist
VAVLADDFEFTVNRERSRAVVTPRGELDVSTCGQLRECLTRLIDDGVTDLVINLSATSFMDSAGLGVLIGAMKRLHAEQGSFSLAEPSRGIQNVLEITGLTTMVDIC